MNWDDAAAFTEDVTAAFFDTTAGRLIPMVAPLGGRDVNARPIPDAGRVEFDFLAMLDLEPSQDSIPRHLPADPGITGLMVAYDACVTGLVTAWPYLPKRGDRVMIGSDLYEIKLERQDGSPRRAYYLNRVK
jgi:hypothetical protein